MITQVSSHLFSDVIGVIGEIFGVAEGNAMQFNVEAGYCDLHLHIVPGIDDGARTVDASLDILRGLMDLGYRHFVATPHADDHRFTYPQSEIFSGFAKLREAVAAAGLQVDLACGAEYTFGERFRRDVQGGEAITLAGSRYVLLELPEAFVPASMPATLFEIGTRGYFPVLAHPERCRPYQDSVEALEALASGRALVQVSFRSLAGTFGRTIKKTAWRLVEEGIADLVATDCHSPRELKKVVKPVIRELERRLARHHLQRIMYDLPRRMMSEV